MIELAMVTTCRYSTESMLFEFQLRPVDEIEPWTEPKGDAPSLSWFALTDGFYRMKVGEELLFNYSEEYTRYMMEKDPKVQGSWVDYQVVRLWEDLLELLLYALSPVPEEITRYLATENISFSDLHAEAIAWIDQFPEPDSDGWQWKTFNLATEWFKNRTLSGLHLRHYSSIWIWSHADKTTITWEASQRSEEGLKVWSAGNGSYTMTQDEFFEEVRRFNDSLLAQMEERVTEISAHWNRPDIAIDVARLRCEQTGRAQWLAEALNKPSPLINWTEVLRAIRVVRKPSER